MNRNASAFSLVELSIVLVILGLLTGGILAGQSLIRAAELRSISVQYNQFIAATNSFKDKYFAIPGDINNATAFWGYSGGTGCTNSSGTAATTPGTCDGSGDGLLNQAGAANQSGENFQFWRQLALAGLIEGNYSGLAGSNTNIQGVAGSNIPKSKISNGAWYAYNWNTLSGNGNAFDNVYNNSLEFGAVTTASDPNGTILKPEELWNIDTKIDDGLPGQGKVLARVGSWAASNCTTATASSQTSATYNLSATSPLCAVFFRQAF